MNITSKIKDEGGNLKAENEAKLKSNQISFQLSAFIPHPSLQ